MSKVFVLSMSSNGDTKEKNLCAVHVLSGTILRHAPFCIYFTKHTALRIIMAWNTRKCRELTTVVVAQIQLGNGSCNH